MPKMSGLGWTTFSVDDAAAAAQDIRNDCKSLSWSTPRAVIDTTGIDKSAIERILGLADFSGTVNGTFNPDADKSHAVFSTIPSTSVTRTVSIGIGGKTLAPECLLTDYPLSRADDGAFTWAVPFVLQSGNAPTWA